MEWVITRMSKVALGIIPVLILSVIASAVVVSAQSPVLEQTFPTVQSVAGGPSCNVGGNPDQRACPSMAADNVPAPPPDEWVSGVRWDSAFNWSVVYGAWLSNASIFAEWTNTRSVTVDLMLNLVLHNIVNQSQSSGGHISLLLSADTPYVTINVKHIWEPEQVTWRGEDLVFQYDASLDGGTLTLTPTFTAGTMIINFPNPSGGMPTSLPLLPGLTNFQPFDLVPNVGQLASFSCNSVTLTDPRGPQAIADTRLWIFDWGDGTAQTRTQSPVASHLYGSPGVYNVTMTVQTADGSGLGYAGRVDTTTASCVIHTVRSIGFVILTAAFAVLIACSFVLPRKTKKEKRVMRRKAAYALVAVFILVVVV